MLSLVEPIDPAGMCDRPNLGCAMLIAACAQKGIDTTLIRAQTRYIRDMFVEDGEEVWNLYRDLGKNATAGVRIRYGELFRDRSLDQFQEELKKLYDQVVAHKTIRSCFNAPVVRRFLALYNDFTELYSYYINHSDTTRLRLVDRYVEEIVKSRPRYLGWSLKSGFDPLSRTIRKRVKEAMGIPIILGGAFTPFIDLKQGDALFRKEHFDYLVVGAGEPALPALLESLEAQRVPDRIPNVVYPEGSRIRAGNLEVVSDLNALPYPDFSQFDLDRYLTPVRILPVQTARGCYWRKCAFCSHHRIDRGQYKEWEIERVVEILARLKNDYSCSHFFLEDESVSPKRARKISEAILRRGLRVKLDMRGRFEEGFNDDHLLGLMRKAGFSAVSWGLESACRKVLNAMDKGTRKETIEQVLRKASGHGIANLCFIMCGFPTETEDDFRETMDFLVKNDSCIDWLMSSVFTFDGHAPVAENPDRWGIVVERDGTISTREGMTRAQVPVVYEKALARYGQFLEGKRRFAKFLVSGYDSGHIVRMIIFIVFSDLIPGTEAIRTLERGDHGAVYPLLPGELKVEKEGPCFFPVDTARCFLDNFMDPEDGRPVDAIEAALVEMADGTRNVEQMFTFLQENKTIRVKGRALEEKISAFFVEMLEKERGVCLGRKT